ncbi:uncharacterized protein LOC118266533 [Spodoptera frugiperda]|uniref:Uncharacterized protein LOC118266533 n=1 Tax=Spodoptera frugiperda TaxID=7108 RepID=A0A9R0D095_SPOFR|nr:uncharacterized protein LOC118266533 [Spodoptera frugiperda]
MSLDVSPRMRAACEEGKRPMRAPQGPAVDAFVYPDSHSLVCPRPSSASVRYRVCANDQEILCQTIVNMTRNVCFTERETARLVNIYKDYDCLWNPKHEAYRDQATRLAAYKEILEKLNIPNLKVKDVPIKIKNLRSTYYQEIKRIRRSVRAGGPTYKPKVSWFKTLHNLLEPFVFERPYATKQPNKDIISQTVATPLQVEDKPRDNYTETERVTSRNNSEDEFDSFGKYIAITLRSMPPEFSIVAKTELQKTLSEIQLKVLREMPAGSSINHQQHIIQPSVSEVSVKSENDDSNMESTNHHTLDSWDPCLFKTETVTDY